MQSIFDKLRVVVKGNTHALLDKIIDLNSPTVVAQYIRELDDARQDIRSAIAETRGEITGLNRDMANAHAKEAQLDTQVKLLVQAGNDAGAQTLLEEQMTVEEGAKEIQGKLDAANQMLTNYSQVESAMSAKINEMESQLTRLKAMNQAASSQEHAAKAITDASEVMGSVGGNGIDDVLAKSEHRQDVAAAKLSMAMGSFQQNQPVQSAEDAAKSAAAAARLAELKAKMAGTPA